MEQLKMMKECLMASVQGQMGNLQNVDTQELGAAIDMIKDLEEALYYCTITKSMEESEKYGKEKYYMERDMDRPMGRMYYDGGRYNMRFNDGHGSMYYSGSNGTSTPDQSSGSRYYTERDYPNLTVRDYREGRSPMSRRTYIESKEMHKDKQTQIKELEQYMHELSEDLIEMIEDSTPEERQLLHKKMHALTEKIEKLNV